MDAWSTVDEHSDIGAEHIGRFAEVFRQVQKVTTGPIVEFGTRSGGSALMWLTLLREAKDRRPVWTVDPYGKKHYPPGAIDHRDYKYGDEHYGTAKQLLAPYVEHSHFLMTSGDFLRRMHRCPYWDNGTPREMDQLGFAFLDGDHSGVSVIEDVLALRRWLQPTGVVLVDNVDWNGPRLNEILRELGPVFAAGGRYIAIQPRVV